MATKKITLTEFKELVKNIIKEENGKENFTVKENRVINQLTNSYDYSRKEAGILVKKYPNMNATAINNKEKNTKEDQELNEEELNEIKNDIRHEDIVENINRVITSFRGSIIKVIFNDNSSITFEPGKNKKYQNSSDRNNSNFAVEVKRYIQKNHKGNNDEFLEEFQYFRGFRQTTESKKRY